MIRVIALIDDTGAYQRLALALQGHAVLERVPDRATLRRCVGSGGSSIVVLGINRDTYVSIEIALCELRCSPRVTRVVLHGFLDAQIVDALFYLPGRPADDYIVFPHHDLATIRQRVLGGSDISVAVGHLRRLLGSPYVAALGSMFDWCLLQAEEDRCARLTVGNMARDAGRSRVDVGRRVGRITASAPSNLIAWVRVLLAVQLWDTRSCGLAVTAEAIGLSSTRALCRLVRRKTGLTFAEIHKNGGVEFVAGMFRKAFVQKDNNGPDLLSDVQ